MVGPNKENRNDVIERGGSGGRVTGGAKGTVRAQPRRGSAPQSPTTGATTAMPTSGTPLWSRTVGAVACRPPAPKPPPNLPPPPPTSTASQPLPPTTTNRHDRHQPHRRCRIPRALTPAP
ncbi:hypothetical protein PLESTB_001163300 [Pleodorina starrii]|uniref:Uncharacterized protein n=1 Tax=Pleodorina starrii TaxID=330485 RepID=A0A9W6BRJ1_9CHLO|nr:hypothetical protein PLESTB_001163300 [Pleodorina starrii]